MRDKLQQQLTDKEVAATLDMCQKEWQEMKFTLYNSSILSLDAPVQNSDQDSMSLEELLRFNN